MSDNVRSEEIAKKELAKKDEVFAAIAKSIFAAVVGHTLNLQSEAILFRVACKGDLAKAARLAASANAAAGLLGVIVNQIGGKLSDSFGRKPFYLLGPLLQAITGLASFTFSTSPMVLAIAKTVRMLGITFSGTVMGSIGMKDAFPGQEYAVRSAKLGGVVGVAIMAGPLLEGLMLKRLKSGSERMTFLGLAMIGSLATIVNSSIPETLPEAGRPKVDLKSAVAGANPFGFINIYTKGTPLLKRAATITTMQSMIDGKNMSDLGQIWMREHLKLSIDGIRNFVMGFGFLSMLAGVKLVPTLLKTLSVAQFTTFTNLTNVAAFTTRGLRASPLLYFAALPLMLPGVNGASGAALGPVVNREMLKSGFQVGESTAWINNLRVMASVVATLLYANCYAFCKDRGVNPGVAYILAGAVGALIPEALFQLTVDKSLLQSDDKANAKPSP